MSPIGSRDELRRDFPAPGPQDWRDEAERLLHGASVEQKLRTLTPEGLLLEPIYTRRDLEDRAPLPSPTGGRGRLDRKDGAGWLVAQEQTIDEPTRANARLLAELERGLDAVLAVWPASLPASSLEPFLHGVDLTHTPILLHGGTRGGELRARLETMARTQGIESATLRGAVAADPLGACALDGHTAELPAALDELAETVLHAAKATPRLRSLWIRGEAWHEAGAHAVQELGITLSILVETLRALESRGLEPARVAPGLMISLGVGGRFFTELCKLRAMRALVARVLESCGVDAPDREFFLHARCSSRNQSRLDEHVNLLRSTTEAFAAAVGGAESIHVEAFDAPSGQEAAFSRRLARNQQLILREEAQLGRVLDPARGSWYVERHGAELAEAAWSLLQEIEAEGGFLAALRAGSLQRRVADNRSTLAQRLATRREIRVGTNQYPGPLAANPAVEDAEQAPGPLAASADHLAGEGSAEIEFPALLPYRECAPFEALRGAVEGAREKGNPLEVFVITLGDPTRYVPRLDFTRAAFEVGGFGVSRSGAVASVPDAVEAARREGARVIAICGLDESYREMGVALAEALKESLPGAVLVLAGLPDDERRARLEEAGVEHFLHLRCDLLALLESLAVHEGVRP